MRIGSLFSGIGGLELGLELSGIGKTVWQVEQNEKLQNCLKEHWPNAQRFSDVREVGSHNLESVDLICGGFPCQDVSGAGKGAGLSGARSGLWFEFARIVKELHPRWVVVENVASGAPRWVDAVRNNLAELNYASLPIKLQANDVGLMHRRSRVFIVANIMCKQQRREQGRRERSSRPDEIQREQPSDVRQTAGASERATKSEVVRGVHGLPRRMDRISALGNSVVPQCAQVIGEVIKVMSDI